VPPTRQTAFNITAIVSDYNHFKSTYFKPISDFGIQIWGTASTENTEILERFQATVLGTTVDTPWYVPNTVIRKDHNTPRVKEEIRHYSSQYITFLNVHLNGLAVSFMAKPDNRRLQRHLPKDMPTKF
jgi:hypothetical protein